MSETLFPCSHYSTLLNQPAALFALLKLGALNTYWVNKDDRSRLLVICTRESVCGLVFLSRKQRDVYVCLANWARSKGEIMTWQHGICLCLFFSFNCSSICCDCFGWKQLTAKAAITGVVIWWIIFVHFTIKNERALNVPSIVCCKNYKQKFWEALERCHFIISF